MQTHARRATAINNQIRRGNLHRDAAILSAEYLLGWARYEVASAATEPYRALWQQEADEAQAIISKYRRGDV